MDLPKLWPALLATCALSIGTPARADDSTVEQCTKSLGTLAVAESQTGLSQLSQYGLGSPAAILRMMVQKSGCFDVVERGVAMQNLQQERAMAQSGDLRQDSNVGKGQMQAADFVMTPNVQLGAKNTGGVGGGLGGLFRGGPMGAFLGGVSGGLKFKEASTSLLIADVRSGIQVASAEGQASKTDFSISGWGFNGLNVGSANGFTNTPEGKVVAASFLDNYNKIVASIRNQPQLIRPGSAAGDNNAAGSTRAQAPQVAGEMLAAKIANVKVYEAPRTTSKVIATLRRSDELVATGEVENGFVKVDAADFSGWVQRTLLTPIGASPRSDASPLPSQSQPVPAQVIVSGALPRGFSGLFSGFFFGPDQGDFQVTVLDNGMVTGKGRSGRTGNFGISGNVAPTGAVQMTSAGQAGGAQFIGTIEPTTGRVTGSWYVNGANEGGTFAGQRR